MKGRPRPLGLRFAWWPVLALGFAWYGCSMRALGSTTKIEDTHVYVYVHLATGHTTEIDWRAACAAVSDVFECEEQLGDTAMYGSLASESLGLSDVHATFADAIDVDLGTDATNVTVSVGRETFLTKLGGTIFAQNSMEGFRLATPFLMESTGRAIVISRRLAASGDVDRPAVDHSKWGSKAHLVALLGREEDTDARLRRGLHDPSGDGAGVTIFFVGDAVEPDHADFHGGRVVQSPSVAEMRSKNKTNALAGDDDDEEKPPPCATWYGTHYAGLVNGLIHGVADSARLVSVRASGSACFRSQPLINTMVSLRWVLERLRERADTQGTDTAAAPTIVFIQLVVEVQETDPATVAVLEDLVRSMQALNATVVTLAGARTSDACNFSPARMPEVVTASALDAVRTAWSVEDGRYYGSLMFSRWDKSNAGPCVDVWAPGTLLESASSLDYGDTAVMSGTMQAASLVAGVAARILGETPHATPDDVRTEIVRRAANVTIPGIPRGTTHARLRV